MATRIYGLAEDEVVIIAGDIQAHYRFHQWTEIQHPGMWPLCMCSDGTVLTIRRTESSYIWRIQALQIGTLFDRLEYADDEDDPFSDHAYLHDGLQWGYVAMAWREIGRL